MGNMRENLFLNLFESNFSIAFSPFRWQKFDSSEKCARIFHGSEEKAFSLQFEHYIGNMIYGWSSNEALEGKLESIMRTAERKNFPILNENKHSD
jgi:hypothetical protein